MHPPFCTMGGKGMCEAERDGDGVQKSRWAAIASATDGAWKGREIRMP